MKLSDFSPLQQKAVLLKDGNVLVSAGAGSGKTAVLIQRLYEFIKNGDARLDQLLVLTFTNFAAKELKMRLKNKLNEDPETSQFASLVEASDITTFDAFALKILKKFSYHLNLDSEVSIFDMGLYKIKRRQIIDQILAQDYENENPEIVSFIHDYLKNNDQNLIALIEDFDDKANLEIDTHQFTSTFINCHYSPARFNQLMNELQTLIDDALRGVFQLIELIDNSDVQETYQKWTMNFSSLSTYEDYHVHLPTIKLPRISQKIAKEDYEQDLELLKQISNDYKKIPDLIKGGTREDMRAVFEREKKVGEFIVHKFEQLQAELNVFKNKHRLYTFSDVARLAYQIIADPKLNQMIALQYQFILVDEYQDTSDIQEAFVTKIARNNVYMVGDIKQSIYGFRNANPKIFREKYRLYQQNQGGTLLNLVDNYRSRREVVNSVNAMLNEIMSDEFGGANYIKDHQIGFGNKSYDSAAYAGQAYDLEVLRYVPSSNMDAIEQEALLVGQDIISKINSDFMVFDKKTKTHRKAKFSDFTILTRKRKFLTTFLRVFNELQIPLYTADNQDAKESVVVKTLFSLLKLYKAMKSHDYGDDFRTSFISVARSFIFTLDDQTIYDFLMSKNETYHSSEICRTMAELVEKYQDYPSSFIVEQIIHEFKIYEKIITLGDVDNNRATLLTILKMITNLEQYELSFEHIIEHFEFYYKQEEKIEVSASDIVDDAVTMMTIHSSKGLEFPLVYMIGFSSSFNFKALYETFRVSPLYGLILPSGRSNEAKTLAYHLDYHANLVELISEEIRLLYVALTRPEEKMIILEASSEKAYVTRKIAAKSLLDLLRLTNYFNEHVVLRELDFVKQAPQFRNESRKQFNLIKFALPQEAAITKRASKALMVPSETNQEALTMGKRFHRYLELVDLTTKDSSFIRADERPIIDKVLALDLFADINDKAVYREYRYFDEIEHLEAVIDLFILRDNHIELIDYKLSSIEDEAYIEQLETYANYLHKTFKLPVKIYLLSIFRAQYRYIKQIG